MYTDIILIVKIANYILQILGQNFTVIAGERPWWHAKAEKNTGSSERITIFRQ